MKKLLIAALAVPALILHVTAQDAPKEPKDKVSYSIGLNFGSNLKTQGVEVNQEMLIGGIKDALSGAKPRLTDQDMETTMRAFATEMQAKMQVKQMEMSGKNKVAGDAFLAANKKKEGWTATASGLQYKVLTTGKGEKPKATDTVMTNYRGTTIDGKEFDSSYKNNEPAELHVDGVIPGWTEALQMMAVGSKWQIALPPNLAYGENAPPEIGPNSVLLFDLELVGVKGSGDAKPAAEKTK